MNLLPPALQHRFERDATARAVRVAKAKKYRLLKKEAYYYWPKIRQTLERLRYRHELPESKKPGLIAMMISDKRGVQTVRCSMIAMADDYIAFKVDVEKLPWGTTAAGLLEPLVGEELSISCGRVVTVKQDPTYKGGIWIEVTREGSIANIPSLFPFDDAYDAIPEDAHPLTFCIGIGPGRTLYTDDLNRVMSLLIAGSIGSGKSVMLNQLLLTLCLRNSPRDLKLYLFDFKGGVELTFYKKLPHVREFVKEVDDISPKIAELHDELVSRQGKFLDNDVNIDEYNKRVTNPADKLPYIVVIVDEFAEIALGLSGKEKERTIKALTRLFQKGRAAGIYFVLATQSPTKEVMDKLIKHNIPTRLAFNCSTIHQSISVVGDSMATNLSPRGRGVWAADGVRTFIQAPFASKAEKLKRVEEIVELWSEQAAELTVDYDEILLYALQSLDGKLSRDRLFKAFKDKITFAGMTRWLSSIENTIVEIDGGQYWVFRGPNPSEPRRLTPIVGAHGETEEEQTGYEFAHKYAVRRSSSAFLKGNGDMQYG